MGRSGRVIPRDAVRHCGAWRQAAMPSKPGAAARPGCRWSSEGLPDLDPVWRHPRDEPEVDPRVVAKRECPASGRSSRRARRPEGTGVRGGSTAPRRSVTRRDVIRTVFAGRPRAVPSKLDRPWPSRNGRYYCSKNRQQPGLTRSTASHSVLRHPSLRRIAVVPKPRPLWHRIRLGWLRPDPASDCSHGARQ